MGFKSTKEILGNHRLRKLVNQLANTPAVASNNPDLSSRTLRARDSLRESSRDSAHCAEFEKLTAGLTAEQACALLQHDSAIVRAYLARYVANSHCERIAALKPLLADQSKVRRQDTRQQSRVTLAEIALEALDQQAHQKVAQEVLLEVARDVTMGAMRGRVLPILARTRPRETTAIALTLLDCRQFETLRSAIRALGVARARGQMRRIAALAGHDDQQVRELVARTLGQLCDTEQAQRVLEALADDEVIHIRVAVAAAYPHCPKPNRARMTKLLDDDSARVRRAAARGLAERAAPEMLALLEPILMSDGAPARAMEALVDGHRFFEVTDLVRELLGSADCYVRCRAATYLAEVGDRLALPDIRALMTAATIHERQAAAAAVAKLGDRASIPQLVTLLGDANPHARIAAVKALVELKATETLPAVERAVQEESTWAKKTLVEQIARL